MLCSSPSAANSTLAWHQAKPPACSSACWRPPVSAACSSSVAAHLLPQAGRPRTRPLAACLLTFMLAASPTSSLQMLQTEVLFTFPPPLQAGNRRPSKTRARLTRTGLGLGALLLATSIPYFGYFMAVIGSFLTLTVSVIFPSACYLRLYGDSLSKPEKLLNYGVITLGILCATSGTAVSVHDLLQEM